MVIGSHCVTALQLSTPSKPSTLNSKLYTQITNVPNVHRHHYGRRQRNPNDVRNVKNGTKNGMNFHSTSWKSCCYNG